MQALPLLLPQGTLSLGMLLPSVSIVLCAKCMATRTLAQHVGDYHELM
jgi:hypothetical protein